MVLELAEGPKESLLIRLGLEKHTSEIIIQVVTEIKNMSEIMKK